MPINNRKNTSSDRQRAIEKIEERKRRDAAASKKAAGKTTSGTKAKTGRETALNWKQVQADVAKVKTGNGSTFLKLEQGENRIRLMMNPGGDSFYTVRREAYLPVGGKNGKGQTIVSPKTDDDSAYCPLCVVSDALKKTSERSRKAAWKKKAEEISRRIRPKSTYYSNAVIKQGQAWTQGVLSYGPMVFQGIATGMKHLVEDEDDDDFLEEGNVAHPDTGKIIIIERTGTMMQTRYAVTITPKGLALTDAQLEGRTDIDQFKETTDADDIEDALCELWGVSDFDELTTEAIEDLPLPNMSQRSANSEDDDDDDDEKPARRSARNKQRTAAPKNTTRKKVEEEDDEDIDDDDEDEEDEPPVRKKASPAAAAKSKRRAPVEEDDEDEEDDDDDDNGGLDDDDMPPCIGAYGKPDKGYKCKGCPHAKLCKDLG